MCGCLQAGVEPAARFGGGAYGVVVDTGLLVVQLHAQHIAIMSAHAYRALAAESSRALTG